MGSLGLQRRRADGRTPREAVNTVHSTTPLLTEDERRQAVNSQFTAHPAVAPSRDQNAEESNMHDKIVDAFFAATRQHPQNRRPNVIYIGRDEARVMDRMMARADVRLSIRETKTRERKKWMGMDVFRVDAGNHVGFGWARDDETRRTAGGSMDASRTD